MEEHLVYSHVWVGKALLSLCRPLLSCWDESSVYIQLLPDSIRHNLLALSHSASKSEDYFYQPRPKGRGCVSLTKSLTISAL